MKEIKADNYSIWIGNNSLSKLDVSEYSKIGILVDENTKELCLPLLSDLKEYVIIEIESGEKNKNRHVRFVLQCFAHCMFFL